MVYDSMSTNMSNKKNKHPYQSSAGSSVEPSGPLFDSIQRMRADGFQVFPTSFFDGEAENLGQLREFLNFTALSPDQTTAHGCGTDDDYFGGCRPLIPGGFTSSGSEQPVEHCGDPDKGFIAWGAANNLPNFIALANQMLVYTSTGIKFNVDVASGLGIKAYYRFFSNAGATNNEDKIPFQSAGAMIQERIRKLQKEIYALVYNHSHALSPSQPSMADSGSDNSAVVTAPQAALGLPVSSTERFVEKADYFMDSLVKEYEDEIERLRADYKIWKETNEFLKRFNTRTNFSVVNQRLMTDLITFGICFPEVQLSSEVTRQPDNSQWRPVIVGLGHRNALTCRLERHDEQHVSRHIYLSNAWLNIFERHENEYKIDALPAIDPMRPCDDLTRSVRAFRNSSRRQMDSGVKQDIYSRPTRFIMPVSYYTAGRCYYPVPSYWAIYNDIYQFASTIIRDRAVRKQNENMFGRIIYVHSEYLDRLVNQINNQRTDEEKRQIKDNEIRKIKRFLSDKLNNGQTFAACTFIGRDGKDHDAFRVETVPYNTKNAAEADKTEIIDISSIILFALECHPDLIGSTPGGTSRSGGTYQREMLQIKEYKSAPTQNLLLEVYNLVRDFNGLDEHLFWKVEQKTLTTLDRNHSGEIIE